MHLGNVLCRPSRCVLAERCGLAGSSDGADLQELSRRQRGRDDSCELRRHAHAGRFNLSCRPSLGCRWTVGVYREPDVRRGARSRHKRRSGRPRGSAGLHEASSAPVRHGAGLKPGTKPIGSMRLIAKVPAKESQRHSGWVLIEVFFVVVRSFPPRIAVVSGSVRRCAGAFMRRFDDETFKPA